jgi:hypothetical protein
MRPFKTLIYKALICLQEFWGLIYKLIHHLSLLGKTKKKWSDTFSGTRLKY